MPDSYDANESEIPLLESDATESFKESEQNGRSHLPGLRRSTHRSWKHIFWHGWRPRQMLVAVALALITGGICFAIGFLLPRRALLFRYAGTSSLIAGPSYKNWTGGAAGDAMTKPPGLQIVGFMFFGRRRYVDILECYLRRNLAVNGGWLDKIMFITDTTRDEKDKQWIHTMVEGSGLQGHYEIRSQNSFTKLQWTELWGIYVNDPETIYIKIDDDLVFIDDNAIPRLVSTLIANPTAHNIQANLVNCRQNEWFHLRTGATLPFLPEMKKSWREGESKSFKDHKPDWRYSAMPRWPGSDNLRDSFNWTDKKWRPPFTGHRWLPLEPTPENLKYTPIWLASHPDDLVGAYSHWGIAAQEHYSLFYHLENDSLENYYWGDTKGIWNPWYKHYDVNLMAIYGKTAVDTAWWDWSIEIVNDQWAVTEMAPEVMNRPWLIDTHAIASHFSFHPQQPKLLRTDLLDRYRAYANEKVCDANNQKVRFTDYD